MSTPLTPDRPLRWGILGTGKIAKDFCAAIYATPNNEIAVIAGRSPKAAAEMAACYGGRGTSASGQAAYAELVAATEVDIVYIATVQLCHKDQILLCLAAGKHVLCEKPMCMNAAETRTVVAAARRARRFLMEGHWTHAWPAAREAQQLIADGAIGELVSVASDFSYPNSIDGGKSEMQNDAGGGVSLILGVYPMCMVLRTLGTPLSIRAAGRTECPTPAGAVDSAALVCMQFADGRTGVASYGWYGEGAQETVFVGTKGRVVLGNPAHAPTELTLTLQAGKRNTYTTERRSHPLPPHPPGLPAVLHPHSEGFVYEVQAVEAALRAGQTECEVMPLDASVGLSQAMDEVRAQLGVAYAVDPLGARLAVRAPKLPVAAMLAAAAAAGAALALALRRAA